MNVLWIVSNFPTPLNRTRGVFIQELAQRMGTRCRLIVLVMVPRYPPLPRYATQRHALEELQEGLESSASYDVQYVKVPYLPPWRLPENLAAGQGAVLAAVSALWCALTQKFRPDVIHAHMGLNSFTGATVSRLTRAPLVTTVNGSDINYGTQPRPGNGFRRWATLVGLRSSNTVVGVSQDLCRKVIGLGIPASRVVHVPNGFDASKFHPMDPAKARQELGLPPDGRIVLSVGNLVPVKATDLLIKALSSLNNTSDNVYLYCVGGGPEEQGLRSLARQEKVDHKVRLVGPRPHHEIPLWMNACDLFVMASRNEGWPSVLPEALACGKRVVGTAVGGIPEIIHDEALGELVEPGNAAALAGAISRNLDRPGNPEAICSYAKQFEWGIIVPRLLAIYASAVETGRRRSAESSTPP